MRELGFPVVFDATHSLQLPGGLGRASGGERKYIPALARAGVAAGVDALFMEVHEDPDQAMSDGPNSLELRDFEGLLRVVKRLDALVKETGGSDR
jgi:2-dehydro-3-deoxyphosphooctonate aldolase (KDO 8-P synthase)